MHKQKHTSIRFPDDVRAWLSRQAERNASSINSEAVRAIRERMERTAPQEGQAHE